MNVNKAFVMGNMTRDPEIRQTPSGQSVCAFSVATNRFFTDKSGQKQKQAEFHNVVAWGKQAELVNQYLKKGSIIFVEGRIQTRSWQDPQGQKHWKTEIIAERIQLGPRQGGGEPRDASGGQSDEYSQRQAPTKEDETPIVELPVDDGEEINVKDIPF